MRQRKKIHLPRGTNQTSKEVGGCRRENVIRYPLRVPLHPRLKHTITGSSPRLLHFHVVHENASTNHALLELDSSYLGPRDTVNASFATMDES